MLSLFIRILGVSVLLIACDQLPKYKVKIDSVAMEGTLSQGQIFNYSPKAEYSIGNIIIFTYSDPVLKKTVDFIFRIIAKSGDRVEIRNGDIWINKEKYNLPESSKYHFVLKEADFEMHNLKRYDPNPKAISDSLVVVKLSLKQFKDLRSKTSIDRFVLKPEMNDETILRINKEQVSNLDNFGPIRVPITGEQLSPHDFEGYFYYNLFQPETKGVIKEALYFVLGDNFSDAFDSRYIGLIKHSHIKGSIDF